MPSTTLLCDKVAVASKRRWGRSIAVVLSVVTLACGIDRADAQNLKRADGAQIPVRVYGPAGGCPPTIIFSHGLGGSQDAAAGLGRTFAQSGWRVMVLGHAESGRHILRRAFMSGDLRNRLTAAATDPQLHRARFADLEAAFAEATRECRPSRLLLAGHSMGATTTMLEAGAVARFGRFGKNRFDAYVAVSPQGVGAFFAEGAWSAVNKPVLMITGTNDKGADGDYTTRLPAFQGLRAGPHRLAVIEGANHLELAGTSERFGRLIATLIDDFVAGRPSRIQGVRVDARQ
jgi:dienelactone hydrolase